MNANQLSHQCVVANFWIWYSCDSLTGTVPSAITRQCHQYYQTAPSVLPDSAISITRQRHQYHWTVPSVLPDSAISITRQRHQYHQTAPSVSPDSATSITGQRHQYHQAAPSLSPDSAISITRPQAGRLRNLSNPGSSTQLILSKVSGPALWPTQPPIWWVLQALAMGIKWPGCAVYCSPTVTARVKNGWSYKSTYVVYTDTLPFRFTVVPMKISALQDVTPCISCRCTNISEEPPHSIIMYTLQDHCLNWNSRPHGPEKDNFVKIPCPMFLTAWTRH
jgi:hypothetical protein